MAHALAESVADETERLAVARDFCTKTVAAYWPAIGGYPALRPTPINTGCDDTLTGASSTLAAELGDAAAQLTPELAFYEIGRLYNNMMPRSFRARFGVYYTPPDLVEHLLNQATAAGVDWSACRVLDPACGGGAFLAPIVRRMLVGLGGAGSDGCEPAVILSNLAVRLQGFEIDPFAAWLSQVAGNYFKHLRRLLANEAPPVSLDFVEARQGIFDDVLQETLLTVYRKDGVRRVATAATVSSGEDGSELLLSQAGTFQLPTDASEPWLVPRTGTQARLLKTASTHGSTERQTICRQRCCSVGLPEYTHGGYRLSLHQRQCSRLRLRIGGATVASAHGIDSTGDPGP